MNNKINLRTLQRINGGLDKVIKAENAKSNFWTFLNRDIRISSPINDRVKEQFYSELGSLLESGIDIRTAIEIVIENLSKKSQKNVFQILLQNIINGDTFSLALQKLEAFTAYEYYSVQIGEETGEITTVLVGLAEYYKKNIKQRRKLIGVLIYPTIVLMVATGAVTFMLTFIVPMFSDIFKRFGSDLPFPTKVVVGLAAIIRAYMGWVLLILFGFIVTVYSQRKRLGFRRISSNVILKTPLVNSLISKIYISRFANTMSLLTGSQVPILRSIQISRKMISFFPIEQSLTKVEEQIVYGVPLHKSLAGFTFYPKKMIALIKVGEDVNRLSEFFKKISDQYDDDIEFQTEMLSKMIEPIIIVGLGLVVGAILIAMYLPLFKLGQSL